MRFTLIDRITDIEEGSRVTAVKALSLAEEYLQDHFPLFPVMPGVLMLEAMFQASAWLVRKSEDFVNTVVLLREARNVKFQDFVAPGELLTVHAEILKQDERTTTVKANGTVDGKDAVGARLVLERFNIADRYPQRGGIDAYNRQEFRRMFDLLHNPAGA